MFVIDVIIVRWVSDDFPGIVECELADRFGKVWRFIEKLPVVTDRSLDGETTYPQPGVIACQIANFGHDETGREVVEIDTRTPWGVEAIDGTTRFRVFRDQLVELADRESRVR